jgi:hypothetical protein
LAHDVVICADSFARLRAALARFRADAAIPAVQLRAAQHEVATGIARLRAVQQRSNVRGRGVLAADGQAMLNGRQTDFVALRAIGDAVAHRRVEELDYVKVMSHQSFLPGFALDVDLSVAAGCARVKAHIASLR